jgi:ubiquitin C-terminal hydrolase
MFNGYQQHDAYDFICCLFNIINDDIDTINKDTNLFSIFSFDLESKVKCKLENCLNCNKTAIKELILNLTLENSLEESLKILTMRELIINEYKCDKCSQKTVSSKRLKIINLSNNLIICLKRFNCINGQCIKLNNKIKIPFEIYINDNNKIYKYILHGFIIHSGSYNSGHYIYIGYVNNEWFMFNDNIVSKINNNLEDMLSNSYCLYYKKIN